MMTYHQMALSSTNVKCHYQHGNHDDSGLGSHKTDGDIQAGQHNEDDEDMSGQPVLPHEQMRQQQLEQPRVPGQLAAAGSIRQKEDSMPMTKHDEMSGLAYLRRQPVHSWHCKGPSCVTTTQLNTNREPHV